MARRPGRPGGSDGRGSVSRGRTTRARRAALLLAALVIAAGALLLTPPGRELLRVRLERALSGPGRDARLGALELSLLRRELRLRDVTLAEPGAPPFLTLRSARLRFAAAFWRGRPALEEIEVEGLRVELADRPASDAAAGRPAPGPRPADRLAPGAAGGLPGGVRVGRLRVRDVTLLLRQDGRALEIRGAALEMDERGGVLAGTLRPGAPLRVRADGREWTVAASDTALAVEAGELRFGPLALRAGESRVQLSGALAATRIQVALQGRLDAGLVAGADSGVVGDVGVEAHVSGAPATPQARVTLHAPRLTLFGREAVRLEAALSADAGGATLDSFGCGIAGGSLRAQGRWPWEDGERSVRLDWSGLELTALLGTPAAAHAARPAAVLAGEAEARWTGTHWRDARATARLSAGASGAPGGLGLAGRARLDVAAGEWRLGLEDVALAGLTLAGRLGGPLGDSLESAALRGSLVVRGDDLARTARLLGVARLAPESGAVETKLELSGTLADPRAAFDAEARLLALSGQPPLAGRSRGTLSRVAAMIESFSIEAGGASLSGSGRFGFGTGQLSGHARGTIADLGELAAAAPAGLAPAGRLSLEATLGGAWPRPEASLVLRGDALRLAGQGFSGAEGRLRLRDDAWSVESLELAPSEGGRLRLSGRLGPAPERAIEGTLIAEDAELGAAAAPAGVTRLVASLEASLSGSLADGGGLAAEARLTRLQLDAGAGSLRLAAPARLAYRPGALLAEGLRLDGGTTALELDGRLDGSPDAALRARLHGTLADLAALVPQSAGDDGAASPRSWSGLLGGTLEASVEWRGLPEQATAEARLVVSDARVAAFEDVSLAASYRDGLLTLDELRGRSPAVRAVARGSATGSLLAGWLPERLAGAVAGRPAHGALHVELDAGPAPAQAAPGAAAKVGAEAVGAAVVGDFETDAPDLRRLRGALVLSRARLQAETATIEQVGEGRIEIADGRLRLLGLAWRGPESELRVSGEVRLPEGLPASQAELALAANGRLDLRLLGALASGVEAGGAATVELAVDGPAAAPRLHGSVDVSNGLLRYRPKRLWLDALAGRLALEGGTLRIETLTGSLNGGTFEARGALSLAGLSLGSGRIDATTRGATLDWPRGFLGEMDADLALEIRAGAPTLAGEVRLASGAYTGNPRVLYLDFEQWRAQETQPSVLDALRLELRARTLHDVQVDTIYGRMGLAADLSVGGRLDAPELEGRVRTAPGAELYLGGRNYTVEGLSLDYTKAGGLVPFLRTRATTRVSGYDVTADFTGALDAPQGRFASDPPLGEREIASLLTTGRASASGASSDAVSLVAADFLGGVGRSFGLDTVRLAGRVDESVLSADPLALASETNPQSRLTLTKRLTDKLELTLSQALAEGGRRTTLISYRPLRGLEARALQRDDQTYAFELRHDLSFGAGARAAARRAPSAAPATPEARVGSVRVRFGARPEVSGLPDEVLLRGLLRLRPGDAFDYKRWLADRERLQQALAEAGFFEARVFAARQPRAGGAANGEPLALDYEVRPGPRTEVAFEGFEPSAALRASIERAWWQSEYAGSIEADAAQRTRAWLVGRGHAVARVDAVVESPVGGVRRLLVRAEPGPKAGALALRFRGNHQLSSDRLQALAGGDPQRREAFLDPASLERRVVKLAEDEGLLAATAAARASIEDGTALLEVTLDEGPPFRLAGVAVLGPAGIAADAVRSASGLLVGDVFTAAHVEAAREAVRRLYRRRGFVEASVRIDGVIDPESASVAATLRVSEGPRQEVREVVVDGDAGGLGERLAGDAGLAAGQPVVFDEWSEVRQRLYDTGLLRSVELKAEPLAPAAAGETQPVRARLTLTPWPALRLRYGLQLSGTRDPTVEEGTQQFRLGGIAEASRQTLLGRAVAGGVSAQGRRGFLLGRGYLSAPRTFGAPLRSSLFLTRTRADLPVVVLGTRSVLQRDTTELTLEERLKPGRRLELAASYGLNWTRFRGEVFFVGPVEQRLRVARLTGTALLDGRDTIVDPQRGYFHSTSFEYGAPALGSEFSFNRLFVQQYAYLPGPGRTVLASAVRLERASGADQALLTSGRLAAGGATTVRGYAEDFGGAGLGGTATGISTLLVLNQELRFPILGLLHGGVFFDHASRFAGEEGRVLARSGLGLGLRFSTSVGVLRLDFGYPLSGEPRKGRFYLALGQAF